MAAKEQSKSPVSMAANLLCPSRTAHKVGSSYESGVATTVIAAARVGLNDIDGVSSTIGMVSLDHLDVLTYEGVVSGQKG